MLQEGCRGAALPSLNLGAGGSGHGHTSSALFPDRSHNMHCKGSWAGPNAGLDGCVEGKIPHPGSNPEASSLSRAAIQTALHRPHNGTRSQMFSECGLDFS